MSDESKVKYKQFRNYMVNELGITRLDIEAWTKESVAIEVSKVVNKLNLDEIIRTEAKRIFNNELASTGFYSTNQSKLRTEIAELLVKNIKLSLES